MTAARAVIDRGLEIARLLEVDLVYLPSFGAAEMHCAGDIARTAQLLCYALQRSSAAVMIANENTLSASDARRLFDAIRDARARLLFDTQNPSFWGHEPVALAAAVADLLAPIVHVKDGHDRKGDALIGAGSANVAATLDALRCAGFRGSFIIESDYRAAPDARVKADQRALRAMLKRAVAGSALSAPPRG